jgi:hypothetical protein
MDGPLASIPPRDGWGGFVDRCRGGDAGATSTATLAPVCRPACSATLGPQDSLGHFGMVEHSSAQRLQANAVAVACAAGSQQSALNPAHHGRSSDAPGPRHLVWREALSRDTRDDTDEIGRWNRHRSTRARASTESLPQALRLAFSRSHRSFTLSGFQVFGQSSRNHSGSGTVTQSSAQKSSTTSHIPPPPRCQCPRMTSLPM